MFFVGCRFRVFDIICDGFRELGYVNVDFGFVFFWRFDLLFCLISKNFFVVLVMLFVILL